MSNHHDRPASPREALTRRLFLNRSLQLTAGAAWIGTGAARAQSKPSGSPNATIRVGLIGCGSRGPYLGYVFQSQPNVQVTAVCDVYEKHVNHAAELVSRIGAKPKIYVDYRRLLAEAQVDAVVIATNVHWHVIPAIEACAAGKDVYLEKPVGATVEEGQAAIAAAKRYNRIVQMGMQQQSWPHYLEAIEIIRSGKLGEISEVHVWDVRNMPLGAPPDGDPPPGLDWDFWLGPAPKVAYNPNRQLQHDWFFDYSGGWQLVWGAHHMGIVHQAMGVGAPVAASGFGGKYAFAKDNREWPDTFDGACEYPSGPVARQGFLLRYVCRTGCGLPIHGRYNGKAFHGTEGVLVLNRQGYAIYPEKDNWDGEPKLERVVPSERRENDIVFAHVASFLEAVRNRSRPVIDVQAGHLASNPGHLMNIAWRLGRRVQWDGQRERIKDDDQANRLLSRRYRSPWVLPA